MRREPLRAVAEPRRCFAGDRLGENAFDAEREKALRLREVQVLPLAGAALVAQRGEQRGGAVQASYRIAERHMHHGGRGVRRAGKMRQPGGLFHRRAIGAVALPRAVDAERWHRDHHQRGVRGAQHVVAQAELWQHAGRVVLHHDVRDRHQPFQ